MAIATYTPSRSLMLSNIIDDDHPSMNRLALHGNKLHTFPIWYRYSGLQTVNINGSWGGLTISGTTTLVINWTSFDKEPKIDTEQEVALMEIPGPIIYRISSYGLYRDSSRPLEYSDVEYICKISKLDIGKFVIGEYEAFAIFDCNCLKVVDGRAVIVMSYALKQDKFLLKRISESYERVPNDVVIALEFESQSGFTKDIFYEVDNHLINPFSNNIGSDFEDISTESGSNVKSTVRCSGVKMWLDTQEVDISEFKYYTEYSEGNRNYYDYFKVSECATVLYDLDNKFGTFEFVMETPIVSIRAPLSSGSLPGGFPIISSVSTFEKTGKVEG